MDFNNLNLYFNTIRFLKFKQILYRILNTLKKRHSSYNLSNKKFDLNPISWEGGLCNHTSLNQNKKSFNFLNKEYKFFDGKIDWNFSDYGKLWLYNLNYFDFLNQKQVSKEYGLQLINDYISFTPKQKDGFEPYPISIRSLNWIKFIVKNEIHDLEIDRFLFRDIEYLYNNLEYHLLGNHLLENAFALLFSSYYFQNDKFYKKSKLLILEQLNEQILNDGAHFELSPMYHKIILHKVLDSINLIKLNPYFKNDNLLKFLLLKAAVMTSWLKKMIYNSGLLPMVNDSTNGVAIESDLLFDYAKSLGVINLETELLDSGYRKFNNYNYEILVDIGKIGPDYQPGHAHSDTFNFELHLNKSPIIVDTGISTYDKNKIRQNQRSTFSHNTVMIKNFEQSEVWGGFRVGRRAKVFDLKTTKNHISASHDGYKRIGIIHNRSFDFLENNLIIKDILSKSSEGNAKAMFHFHSDIHRPEIFNDRVTINDKGVVISFTGHSSINIYNYALSSGFNKTIKSYKLVIDFDKYLETNINL